MKTAIFLLANYFQDENIRHSLGLVIAFLDVEGSDASSARGEVGVENEAGFHGNLVGIKHDLPVGVHARLDQDKRPFF